MRSATVQLLAALPLTALLGGAAVAADDGPVLWRALGARALDRSFTTSLSAKKATRAEAIRSMREHCDESKGPCTLVATFDADCRFVARGSKQVAATENASVFVVGSTVDDAKQRCQDLGLDCTWKPQGGCFD